jgi:hypothetical protein
MISLHEFLRRVVHLVLVSSFFPAVMLAQLGGVGLRGQVTDQSGAVVSHILVMLIGPGDVVREVTTEEPEGRYVFRDLPAGTYTLRVHVKGFADVEKPGIVIARGQPQVVDVRLEVVMEQQEVTVKEEGAHIVSLSSSNNASAVTLQGDDLQALSDDPTDLEADLQALAGPSAGPNGGAMYVNGFSGGTLPAKESIREIRINQNPFSPEYDKLGYGRIEILTKPGSEKYHGTMNYNFGDDFWNSRNPYSTQKAPFLLNEIEGNLGSPLGKRASFAVEWQRNMVDNGSITNVVTLDPQTLAPVPFTSVLTTPQRFTRINPRIDYQLNQNNTLTVAYDFTRSDIRDAGIGAFNLISQGYHVSYTDQNLQLTETAVIGKNINETRFQYYRTAMQMISNDLIPEIRVLGSFIGGGSQNGQAFDTQNSFELQNYTSIGGSRNTWRFGIRLRGVWEDSVAPQNFNGTFTFGGGLAPELDSNNQPILDGSGNQVLTSIKSIERYRRTLLFQQMGDSPAQIQASGGGATQFSIDTGNPNLSACQMDLGVFAGDEWLVRPNITVDLGLRYEAQNFIHDWHDFAPRVAISWAPGGGSRAKTVLRAGFGMFYDRFPLSDIVTAERYNGIVQQQYVVTNPNFFPTIPSTTALATLGYQSTDAVSPRLRAPYYMQSAVTVERQLSASTAFALTYTNSHGVHLFRSTDINAPLPGTYNPNVPGSGAFPVGHPGPVFRMESTGIYNQNQIVANVSTRLNRGVSLFGFYVLNYAMSSTDGIDTVPANPYNFAGEYGPAATDVRHRVTFGGSINTKWNVRVSPFVIVQSGPPFDITTGSDLYGTTLFNSRPGIATDPRKPGLIQTSYGLLDPNLSPDEHILGRNYGRGPGQVRVNLRVSKAIGFGSETKSKGFAEQRPAASAGGATATQAASGRGLGGIIGNPKSGRRYNMIISMSVQNLLNHTNPGPITGDITSPLFGSANRIAGGPNGEGFFETANNRRLEAQIRFTF